MTVAVNTTMIQRETSAIIRARTVGERQALERKGFRRDVTAPALTWWHTAVAALTPGAPYWWSIGNNTVTFEAVPANPLTHSETEWHAACALVQAS